MSIRITYKDGANWVDIEDKVIYISVNRELSKPGRIIPMFFTPVVISDIWNGKTEKIQETTYSSFGVQFAVKEDQLDEVKTILSCNDIAILDTENNVSHIADTQTAESFIIAAPERIAGTTNSLINVTYRINKTVIDKVAIRANQVTLIGNATYYSKLEKLTYTGENVNVDIPWSDGKVKTIRQTTSSGFNVVLYFNDADLDTFYKDYGQNSFTIDAVPVLQKLPLQITPIAEGITKVIVPVITTVARVDNLATTRALETNNITIDTSNVYYTDYPIDAAFEDTTQEFSTNQTGSNTLTNAITRQATIVKLYMSNSELADFKPRFETSQAITLNAAAVIENRIVSSSPLDFDLNEIIVSCLIATNVLYPQQ